MTAQESLLPCPFCRAEAHFYIDDENWQWVECSSCGMQGNRSDSLMEGCRQKLAEAWNRCQTVARTPLSASDVSALLDLAGHWPGDSSRADFINGIRYAEMEHGITQEKQG